MIDLGFDVWYWNRGRIKQPSLTISCHGSLISRSRNWPKKKASPAGLC
jgi:hypothetical protein